MKNIICFFLVFFIAIHLSAQTGSANPSEVTTKDHVILDIAGAVGIVMILIAATSVKIAFDDLNFRKTLVGKTKNELYIMFGNPDNVLNEKDGIKLLIYKNIQRPKPYRTFGIKSTSMIVRLNAHDSILSAGGISQAKLDEAKLQKEYIGKTKSEVYLMYGTPDSVKVDEQLPGGEILI